MFLVIRTLDGRVSYVNNLKLKAIVVVVGSYSDTTLLGISPPVPACKGPATRNDFVNDIVNDARADAIFATLKAIVDDEKSTISLRVAGP